MGGWEKDDPEGQLPLPDGTVTLPAVLRDAGYVTAAIGTWGLGVLQRPPTPRRRAGRSSRLRSIHRNAIRARPDDRRRAGVHPRESRSPDAVALYDLATDIGEARDVAAEHPGVVARIAEIMRTGRTESEEFPLRRDE